MPGPTVTTPHCGAATSCPARRSGRPTSGPGRAWCWPGSSPTGSPRCTRWSTSIADTRTSWRTCRSWAGGWTGSGRTSTVDPTGVPGRAGDYGVRVRLVVARCSVDYVGRLTAHLDPAVRLLMVKADGSVLVHADGGSYKPLNWMSPPCRLSEADGRWTVENKAGERLLITLDEVLHDSSHDLGVDPGLIKDGVEAHLQALLAEHVATLGEGWTLVRREYPTPIGPVDLMCRDATGSSVTVEIVESDELQEAISELPTSSGGQYVAVEIKRKAT